MSPIAPPPLAELNTLSALLALVNDPVATKAKVDELVAATQELHDASALLSLQKANQQDEDNARLAALDASISAKQATLNDLEARFTALKSQIAALAG